MRSKDPGWEVSERGDKGTWKVGKATDAGWVKHPGSWGTPFSGFRFTIPELCGFKGRAIYLDADMLMLGDIAELWEMAPSPDYGIRCISDARTDVAVFNNEFFHDWMPPIRVMKPSGWRVFEYLKILRPHSTLQTDLGIEWNDCDGKLYSVNPMGVKLIHYTNVPVGQPYRPYPNVRYPKHWPYVDGPASRGAAKLWWLYYQEALTEGHGEEGARERLEEAGGIWQ